MRIGRFGTSSFAGARLDAVRFLAALLFVLLPAAALADKRVALVIGNSAYEYVSKLPNPANDAEDVAAALKRLGFTVTAAHDLDYNQMRLALRDFGDAAAGADLALVYFAGHGIEIENTNYLIPVNAELKSDRDVEFEAIRLDSVIGALDASKGVKIVLIDACRNNPFLSSMTMTTATRSVGRGLARVDPGGVLVGYAARGGTTSLDGKGRNSPFAKAVLTNIEVPGLELGKMFRKIRDSVLEETGGQQEPFTYGSLPGEDIFLAPPVVQASLDQPAQQPATAPDTQSATRTAAPVTPAAPPEPSPEDKLFSAVKDVDSLRGWAIYFRQFPHGAHYEEAIAKEEQRLEVTIWTFILNHSREPLMPSIRKPLDLSRIDSAVASEVETWIGLTGPDDIAVQAMLKREGYYSGAADGKMGPATRDAIRGFQSANGISPTGIVTRATAAALGLPLYTDPTNIKPAISQTLALPLRKGLLQAIGEDPRLVTVMDRYVQVRSFVYGYFRGHVYIAILHDRPYSVAGMQTQLASVGAHLATITSKEENDFVVDLIRRDPSFWEPYKKEWVAGPMIGLMQKPGSKEPAGGWVWVTGEPVTFKSWTGGHPGNYHGNDSLGGFGFLHPDGPGHGKSNWWGWADYNFASSNYVIEIE